MTSAQRESFLQELSAPTVAGAAVTSPWKIGIWFYHLRHSDGSTAHANYDPTQVIGSLNQYYEGVFEFKICGTTNIDNNALLPLSIGSNSSNLANLWSAVDSLDEPLSNNCVRVFLLGEGIVYINYPTLGFSGYTHTPLMYTRPAIFMSSPTSTTWAHELGHYFGLDHTHANPTEQYVNSPVLINGISYSCDQLGDGCCDTPADPECNMTCTSIHCPGGPVLDPLGVEYSPDPSFIMSSYEICRNRFSGEQKQRMRTFYLDHPAYAPVRTPPMQCIMPVYGIVERNCTDYSPGVANLYSFLVNLPVEIRSGAGQSCTAQNNKTDVLGQYRTMPCTLTTTLRRILPDKNFGSNPLNGISTFDLVQINKHILGNPSFENPFQMIAADANNSKSVTIADILEIRKLILGITSSMAAGSWRFVPKLCTETQYFINNFYDGNPFDAEFTDPFNGLVRKYKDSGAPAPNNDSWMDHVNLIITSSIATSQAAWSFTGIKVGDVNCNADVEGAFSGESGEQEFHVDAGSNTSIPSGGTRRVQVKAGSQSEVVAWQFGATYASDLLTITAVSAGTMPETLDSENFRYVPAVSSQETGVFKALWYAPDGNPKVINNEVLFEIQVTANQNIAQLEQVFQLNQETLPFLFYDEDGNVLSNVTLTLAVANLPQGKQGGNTGPTRTTKLFTAKAYPNAFTSEIEFAFTLDQEANVHLEVFNATGALVSDQTQLLPAGPQEMQVSNLDQQPAGLYWYSIQAGDRRAWGKLVKR